ncbi:response regulator transcription factor [Novosphingobium sp.]|uniref:response regulator transcription factor n=1 Tax=Novosphingobium sp. TaxID=1874826 RepID=UPI003BAA8FD1
MDESPRHGRGRRYIRPTSNQGIADALGISAGTIKDHVSVILAKLQTSDRTKAVLRALREGHLQAAVRQRITPPAASRSHGPCPPPLLASRHGKRVHLRAGRGTPAGAGACRARDGRCCGSCA